MREEKVESLIKHHQMQCNRYVNGHCSTRACYTRGGYSGKGPVGNVEATCVDHEWVVMLADHDAALRRAKAEGLEQVSELKKALELYRDASYQGHSSHWDKTGGSGSGCPACLRAIELRAQARQIVDTLDARAAQIEEGE